jgi:hypothetical protein
VAAEIAAIANLIQMKTGAAFCCAFALLLFHLTVFPSGVEQGF